MAKLLSVRQAADYLGITPATFYTMRGDGKLPKAVNKIGNALLFDRDSLADYKERALVAERRRRCPIDPSTGERLYSQTQVGRMLGLTRAAISYHGKRGHIHAWGYTNQLTLYNKAAIEKLATRIGRKIDWEKGE